MECRIAKSCLQDSRRRPLLLSNSHSLTALGTSSIRKCRSAATSPEYVVPDYVTGKFGARKTQPSARAHLHQSAAAFDRPVHDRHCYPTYSSICYPYGLLYRTKRHHDCPPQNSFASLSTVPADTMPPAKKNAAEDSRSDASTVRERQIAAAAHARKSKQNAAAAAAAAKDSSSALKELAAISADAGNAQQAPGVSHSKGIAVQAYRGHELIVLA